MYRELIDHVTGEISFSPGDEALCERFFVRETASAGQVLLEPGYVAPYLYFVNSGYIRTFHTFEHIETVIRLCGPNEFITVFDSFISQHSSQDTIQCITDVDLLRITKKGLDELYASSPAWAKFIRILYQRFINLTEELEIHRKTMQPPQQVMLLYESHPEYFDHVPHHYIASYLGLSPEHIENFLKRY